MRILFLSIIMYGATLSHLMADSGLLDVNWSALKGVQGQGQLSARKVPYPAVLTQGVRVVTLPVYLPASLSYNENMFVVADEHFYSISVPLNAATLMVTGDRTYQQSAEGSPQLEGILLAQAMPSFTRAEGMMTIDFNRYGANYSLVLECDKPDDDSRCLQDGFLKNLYQELIVVGGHS